MIRSAPTLLPLVAMIWLAACSGSDNSTPSSTTNSPPTTAQEPTKPPPTTQPPNMAPPSTQPPGSQPPASAPPGAFAQGTGFNAIVRTIVMAQDGTHDVYVGGDFTTYNGTTVNHIIRLRPNGTIAQTFGQGFDEVVLALALATDGSNALYAGGPFTQFNNQPAPQLIRLTSSGVRDATFQPGTLGFVLEMLGVTEDGSRDVYAAGNISEPVPGAPVSAFRGLVTRLNPDGTPDQTFSIGTGFPGGADAFDAPVAAISVPPGSGKLYAGGSLSTYNGQTVNSLVRLNPNGTLDSTFMTGTGVPGVIDVPIVEVIARAGDGSRDLYAGGRIGNYNGTPVTLGSIRVHETGALDTTFGPTEPMITFTIAPAEDGSGDVFVFGLGTKTNDRPARLLRLNREGGLISTFHEPALDANFVLTIVPVLDGTRDLYIGGTFTTYNGVPVNHIARIHADGSLASVVN